MMNKVEICGVNTSKLPLLTSSQMDELFVKIKKGDKAAREEFIHGNLRLVLSVIQRFGNRGENADDLFQVGCIGLIKAIDNFDITLNVKFSTYAVPMIIGEVRRYLRDNNMIRVSRSVRDLAYKALAQRERLSVALGREATIEEICEEVNKRQRKIAKRQSEETGVDVEAVLFTKQELTNALDAVIDPVSLYDPVYSDGGDSIYIMDQIRDTKNT